MQSLNVKLILAAAAVGACVLLSTGCKKPPPITLSCNAAPPAIYPGEQVTVTATPGSVSTKKNNNVIYSWSGEGVTGQGENATVDTSSLAPGSYTVTGTVKEGKRGKEGLKAGQSADCSAGFTVKEFEPPTISCSASPTTIRPGESSTVSATAMSPQNRPLTYSYAASSGTIEGSGATATFSSAGAPTGQVSIDCKVSDDKNHTATADTGVTIVAPPPPPTPHTRTLCTMTFDQDARRPTRVDNQAKACLDQVALDLQKETDAKLVIVGESNAAEKEKTAKQQKYAAIHKRAKVVEFAAQRAVNAKDYLVTEKGIDASRITTATGTIDGQSAENYLVPAGADFSADVQGTSPVEESTVNPEVRKPLPERRR